MKRAILAAACLGSAVMGCATEPSAVRVPQHRTSAPEGGGLPGETQPDLELTPSSGAGPTTTTEAPTTTVEVTSTTAAPAPVATTVPRRTTTTVYVEPRPATQTPTVHDSDFWYRLATCESENGRTSANQFQFMGGTAEKVGYYAGASYEAQRAMAQDWTARLRAEGTHPGSSAGWPECWWIAGGS